MKHESTIALDRAERSIPELPDPTPKPAPPPIPKPVPGPEPDEPEPDRAEPHRRQAAVVAGIVRLSGGAHRPRRAR